VLLEQASRVLRAEKYGGEQLTEMIRMGFRHVLFKDVFLSCSQIRMEDVEG